MLTRVGVKTSVKWDMTKKTIDISLVAERDTSFELKFSKEIASIEGSGSNILKDSKYGSNYRNLSLDKGQEINIAVKLK